MKALVLDFDGVICDSAGEVFVVATQAYRDLESWSRLDDQPGDTLYTAFLDAMALGNRAEDYGAILAALDRKVPLPDQSAYDAHRAALDPDWLERYHRRFYAVRERLSEADREGWLKLARPFPAMVELLRRRAGELAYAIATSKDRRSVGLLLAAYGIADLFDDALLLDKECGPNKAAHLELARARLELRFDEMSFVDDKVNHLDRVAPLGVRCNLAAWGYNTPREHALARERGYRICTLEEAESQLFG